MRVADFGALRSLLQRPPDEDSWDALCELIEAWPEPGPQADLLPYVRDHVARWDDVHRAMPWRWLEAMMRGQPVAAQGLVRTLDLRSRRLRSDQLERALRGGWTRQLTQAYLDSMGLTADGLSLMAELGQWDQLRVLSLDHNPLGSSGPAPLHQGRWPALESLSVERVSMGSQGLIAAVEAPWTPTLRELDVSGLMLEARDLPESAPVQRLERLALNMVRPGLSAWAVLVAWPWERLRELSLQGRELDGQALLWWLGSPMAAGLVRLSLNWNCIGPQGAAQLAKAPGLGQLRALDLRRNCIGDEGARALMRAPWFEQLQVLRLEMNRLSPALRAELARRPGVLV